MLELKRTAISLDEKELLELERIIVDGNKKKAFTFLSKIVYERVAHSQRHCEVYYARH